MEWSRLAELVRNVGRYVCESLYETGQWAAIAHGFDDSSVHWRDDDAQRLNARSTLS